MADTYYAWSEIIYGAEHDETDPKLILGVKSVKPGEKVDAKMIGVSEEEFERMVETGSIRNYPFPKELQDPTASPNQLIAQQLVDAEGVAAAYGVSPELVDAYSKQRKKEQTGTPEGAEVK